MSETEVNAETVENNEEVKQDVDEEDMFNTDKFDEMVQMDDGTELPWCMVGYTIPLDDKNRLKKPFRKYMSESKCWDFHHPTVSGEVYRNELLKASWLAKNPERKPEEFDPKKLDSEESKAHHKDPQWAKVRKEFLYEHALCARRIAFFKANFRKEYDRCEAERKEQSKRKAAKKLAKKQPHGKTGEEGGDEAPARSNSTKEPHDALASYQAQMKKVSAYAKRLRASADEMAELAQTIFSVA